MTETYTPRRIRFRIESAVILLHHVFLDKLLARALLMPLCLSAFLGVTLARSAKRQCTPSWPSPRLWASVLSDIEKEPGDVQSLIRFLVYSIGAR